MKRKEKYQDIREFLIQHADEIQQEATAQHKKYLDRGNLRNEFLIKYKNSHRLVIRELANNLAISKQGVGLFKRLGELLAKDSVKDGLTLEEAVDGTIFLKQAIWTKLKNADLIKNLSIDEFYQLSQTIGTYADIIASKIAFTYHQERQYIENNLRYLAEASKILSSSLDYQTTLNSIAQLAVPQIADWCSVVMLDKTGNLEQVAIAHKDPKKIKWAKKLRETQKTDMNAPTGAPNVIRTGKSEIYPLITDEMLVAMAKNKEELAVARSIGFTSAMVVPIFPQKKSVGAITFVTTETRRHYSPTDLLIAEELGNRASVAIENAQLYKGSQDAITLRDDFISVASHELRTPITSIKMFTHVLKRQAKQLGDEKAIKNLVKMDKQLNKLTDLIYDLLNVSKIQAGKIVFEAKKFDFDALMKEVTDVIGQSMTKHSIILEGKTDKKIFGDEDRIGQALNNLISNAIKYSPKAHKIIIKLSSDITTVRVSVQDFGIGMAKQHHEKIFQRFYRVTDEKDNTFPGLGIGLYITNEIITRHGGKLWVESQRGKGSTFSFSLPVDGK